MSQARRGAVPSRTVPPPPFTAKPNLCSTVHPLPKPQAAGRLAEEGKTKIYYIREGFLSGDRREGCVIRGSGQPYSGHEFTPSVSLGDYITPFSSIVSGTLWAPHVQIETPMCYLSHETPTALPKSVCLVRGALERRRE